MQENVRIFIPKKSGIIENILDATYGIKISSDEDGKFSSFPKGFQHIGYMYISNDDYLLTKNLLISYCLIHYFIILYIVINLISEGIFDIASSEGGFAALATAFGNHGWALLIAFLMGNIKAIPRGISLMGTESPVICQQRK